MDKLPIELIQEIGSYLNTHKNISRLSLVSKIFNEKIWSCLHTASFIGKSMKNVPLRHLNSLREVRIFNTEQATNLLLLTNLQALELPYNFNDEDSYLLQNVTNVCDITIDFDGSETVELEEIFGSRCSQLTRLICTQQTEVSRMIGLDLFTNLRDFGLQYMDEIDEDNLLPIMDMTKLTRLEFCCLPSTSYSPLKLLSKLTNLESLSIDNSLQNTMEEDYTILGNLQKLLQLTISVDRIGSWALQTIGRLTQLTNLDVSINSSDNKPNFKYLSTLTNLRQLSLESKDSSELSLATFTNLQDVTLERVTPDLIHLPSLRRLRIVNNRYPIKEAQMRIIGNLTQLTKLDFYRKIFDTINMFGQHCTNLTNLISLLYMSWDYDDDEAITEFCKVIQPLTSLANLTVSTAKRSTILGNFSVFQNLQLITLYTSFPYGEGELKLPYHVEVAQQF